MGGDLISLSLAEVKYRRADVSPIRKTGLPFIKTFRHHCPFLGISMTRKNGSFAWNRSTNQNIMSDLTVEKIIEIHY